MKCQDTSGSRASFRGTWFSEGTERILVDSNFINPFKMICRPKLFLLFLLPLALWPSVVARGAQVFNFRGKDFIRYDSSLDDNVQNVVRNGMLSSKNVYRFGFRTIHPSGILLFSEGTREDFISIVLLHCKLRVVIHQQKYSTPEELKVVTGDDLCDGNWHSVQLIRNGRKVCVNLDHRRKCQRMPGQFSTYLDVDLHTFIGGIDKSANIKPSTKHQDIYQVPNYRGCLKRVILNHKSILKAAMKKRKYIKVYGSLNNKNCSGQVLKDVLGFTDSESFLELGTPAKRALLVSFYFRTYYGNGLLLYLQSALFIRLSLVSGTLELQPYIEGKHGIQNQIKFHLGKNLADGNWHFVRVSIKNNGFTLSADGEKITWKIPKHLKKARMSSSKTIYFGQGLGFKSFIGCLNQVKVNKKPTNLAFCRHSGVEIGRCPISNFCFPNPCKHGAKCSNTASYFSCDCSGIYYTGRLCTDPLYRSSCQEYAKLGLSRDSMCSVLPNKNISSMPFKVLCRILGPRMSATVIENGKKTWQKVEKHTSDAVGPYLKTDIHYSMNIRNIKAVISGSKRCHQQMAINLTYSTLNTNNKAYWISSSKRNGNPVAIITDGPIRDKSKLPVIAVMFLPDAIGSYYRVGPLICIGIKKHSPPLPPSIDKRNVLKNMCSPLVKVESRDGNKAHHPEDERNVDTGFPSSKTDPPMKPEMPKMNEKPSVSSTQDKVTPSKEESEVPEFNTNQETPQKKNAVATQDGNRSSHKVLTERWEFLLASAVGSACLILMISFLLVTVLCKRKKKARERSPRESVCDEVALQPESDLWMKINSCGYDVKTGKITYGHDVYRMS